MRFGMNGAEKLADIGFGWGEHGGGIVAPQDALFAGFSELAGF